MTTPRTWTDPGLSPDERGKRGLYALAGDGGYWGTKWDLCDFSLDKDKWFDPSTHSCSFLTAWSPPVELFDYIARQFPKLIFKLVYLEGGFHFSGMVVWHGGKRISTRKFDFVEQGIAKDWFGFNDTECEYIGAMTEDELLVLRLAA